MLKVGYQNGYRCFLAILSVFAATAVFLWSGSAPPAPVNQTVVLTDVRLINGEGGPPLEHAAIVIEGDRIVSLGPADKLHWPKSAKVVNYRNKTVLPGIISDHSHVGQVDGVSLGSQNYNRANILRQLRQYEVYGVTTVTALGMNGPFSTSCSLSCIREFCREPTCLARTGELGFPTVLHRPLHLICPRPSCIASQHRSRQFGLWTKWQFGNLTLSRCG